MVMVCGASLPQSFGVIQIIMVCGILENIIMIGMGTASGT